MLILGSLLTFPSKIDALSIYTDELKLCENQFSNSCQITALVRQSYNMYKIVSVVKQNSHRSLSFKLNSLSFYFICDGCPMGRNATQVQMGAAPAFRISRIKGSF